MNKVALITGITGDDGALLAEYLLALGVTVHGMRLYAAQDDTARLKSLLTHPAFHLHYGDITDGGALARLVSHVRPDEVYNLAGQSHVAVSFAVPDATLQVNTLGTLRLLDAVRGMEKPARLYQASSSEMFGNAPAPQSEETPLHPCSPYGISKLAAYELVRSYRSAYGLHASNGILFNHESPLRGEKFVTRKITRAVAAIAAGRQSELRLGNLDAVRDWGHARDYVEGMALMLRQDTPGDYVLATGVARSVRDFAAAAFACAGMMLEWRGSGMDETGVDTRTGRTLVRVDAQYFRPAELHALIGDATRAREVLGWKPRTGFEALVREMVESDIAALLAGEDRDGELSAAA